MKVLIVSKVYPKYHPRAGEPTWFVQKILHSLLPKGYKPLTEMGNPPKYHTIREDQRWKVGDMASIRIWTGLPYRSKQEEVAQVEIKNIWDFTINGGCFSVNGQKHFGETEGDFELLERIAANDGLTRHDLVDWFKQPGNKTFVGKILCWSDKIQY